MAGPPLRPKKAESSIANQELALRLFGRFVEQKEELISVATLLEKALAVRVGDERGTKDQGVAQRSEEGKRTSGEWSVARS